MRPRVGQRCDVYEDPITRTRLEGVATVTRVYGGQPDPDYGWTVDVRFMADVRFMRDDLPVRRNVQPIDFHEVTS